MICRNCKKKLTTLDLYCLECGLPSESYHEQFKVKKILKQAWENSRKSSSGFNFYFIGIALALLLTLYLTYFEVISENGFFNYLFVNVCMIFIFPLLLLPFATFSKMRIENEDNKRRGKNNNSPPPSPPTHTSWGGQNKGKMPLTSTEASSGTTLRGLNKGKTPPPPISNPIGDWSYRVEQLKRFYPQLLLFTFIMAIYFAFLKLICQGDPILNIVRFILVLWGLAIAFPIPFLIFFYGNNQEGNAGNIITLFKKGYYAGKYLRWQQFALIFFCGILNIISVFLILIPLPETMNFMGNVMYIWYHKQEEFLLYDKEKDY